MYILCFKYLKAFLNYEVSQPNVYQYLQIINVKIVNIYTGYILNKMAIWNNFKQFGAINVENLENTFYFYCKRLYYKQSIHFMSSSI